MKRKPDAIYNQWGDGLLSGPSDLKDPAHVLALRNKRFLRPTLQIKYRILVYLKSRGTEKRGGYYVIEHH